MPKLICYNNAHQKHTRDALLLGNKLTRLLHVITVCILAAHKHDQLSTHYIIFSHRAINIFKKPDFLLAQLKITNDALERLGFSRSNAPALEYKMDALASL
jgi:hypothetical protein